MTELELPPGTPQYPPKTRRVSPPGNDRAAKSCREGLEARIVTLEKLNTELRAAALKLADAADGDMKTNQSDDHPGWWNTMTEEAINHMRAILAKSEAAPQVPDLPDWHGLSLDLTAALEQRNEENKLLKEHIRVLGGQS